MVTHEPDIAAHAERTVVLRDGRVESDRRAESDRLEPLAVAAGAR
jgi:ABC-type lipoprotein export system ATPase subunit